MGMYLTWALKMLIFVPLLFIFKSGKLKGLPTIFT